MTDPSERLAAGLWAMTPDELAKWMVANRITKMAVGGVAVEMHPQAFNEDLARRERAEAEKNAPPPAEAADEPEPEEEIDGEQIYAESIARTRGY